MPSDTRCHVKTVERSALYVHLHAGICANDIICSVFKALFHLGIVVDYALDRDVFKRTVL